jgi:hypothetical protein
MNPHFPATFSAKKEISFRFDFSSFSSSCPRLMGCRPMTRLRPRPASVSIKGQFHEIPVQPYFKPLPNEMVQAFFSTSYGGSSKHCCFSK